MEERVQKLEEFVDDARREFAWVRQEFLTMDVRLTRIETRLEQTATKADVEAIKNDILKWMIGTVIGLFIGFGGLFLAMSNALR